MIIALVPTWLREFEREAGYMIEQKVICLICKELKRHWIVFTGKEALEHRNQTVSKKYPKGHDRWELQENKNGV